MSPRPRHSRTWPTNAAAICPARLSIWRKAGVERTEKEAVALIAKDRIGEIDVLLSDGART